MNHLTLLPSDKIRILLQNHNWNYQPEIYVNNRYYSTRISTSFHDVIAWSSYVMRNHCIPQNKEDYSDTISIEEYLNMSDKFDELQEIILEMIAKNKSGISIDIRPTIEISCGI